MGEEEERAIEKLSAIEKGINKMLEMRQQIVELRETEGQRQKALEELRASEKKYKTLVENIPHRLFMKDRNSVYVFVNEIYAADLKIKPQEISGKTDYDLFPKELAEEYISNDQRIMAKAQLEDTEVESVHEGQTWFVHTVKTPVRDENGDAIGILGIFEDITERKRNEEELQKNCAHLEELVSNGTAELETVNRELQREVGERRRVEERLQKLEGMYSVFLEYTGTAIVVIEEDMVISWANREFAKLSGYPKEAVEGKKSLKEFVAPADLEKIQSALTGRTNLEFVPREDEGQFIGQGGNIKDIRIIAAPVPGVKKAVVSLSDITDRKRTEESLRTLQEQYQALVENAKETILVLQEGRLKFGNPQVFGISGYTEEELTARPFQEFIHPDDREMFEFHIKKLGQEKFSQVRLFRLIHKEGIIRWVESRGALIQWEGKPAVLNFMTDVTDRKQAGEELRNSIETFRTLVSAMEKYFLL